MSGCCGQGRFTKRAGTFETGRAAPTEVTPQVSAAATVAGMEVKAASPVGKAPLPRFRYVGTSALRVTGPRTGTPYLFESPGAELTVHPLDAPLLAVVPRLERV